MFPRETSEDEVKLLKETLEKLAIPWHKAPAEAEAECAQLSKLGIVDAVWTEDSDALMFGAEVVIRFLSTPTGTKDIDNVRIYRSRDILKQYPMLDREGLVLFAVLSGGDYEQTGLRGCGPDRVLDAAKAGLGRTLCRTSDSGGLRAWREQLEAHFRGKIDVPSGFPHPQHLKDYNTPLVSKVDVLRSIHQRWDSPLDERALFLFLGRRFNFWLKAYIEFIISIRLMRSLAQTEPGQQVSNGVYQIRRVSAAGPVQSKVIFLLSAVTFIEDIDSWKKQLGAFGSDRDDYTPQPHVECPKILDCILRHGCPSAMPVVFPNQPPSQLNGAKKRGRPPKNRTAGASIPRHLPSAFGGSKRRDRPPKNSEATASVSKQLPSTSSKATSGMMEIPLTKPRKKRGMAPGLTDSPITDTIVGETAKKARLDPRTSSQVVINLISDDEDEALAPISTNAAMGEKRLRHFEEKGKASLENPHLLSTSSVNEQETTFVVPPKIEEWDMPGFWSD